MKKRSLMAFAGGIGGSLVLSGIAHATIPDASASNSIQAIVETSPPQVTSYSNTDLSTTLTASLSDGSITETADASTTSIEVDATSYGLDNFVTASSSYLTYYYDVVGAQGPVPIDVNYQLGISTSGGGNGYAGIVVSQYSAEYLQEVPAYSNEVNGQYVPSSDTIQSTFDTILTSAGPNQVNIFVAAGTSPYTASGSSIHAYVGPFIYIDPIYAKANPGVELEISPGVGNVEPMTSAAPEPGAWALLLVGIATIGGMLRRGQRHRDGMAAAV